MEREVDVQKRLINVPHRQRKKPDPNRPIRSAERKKHQFSVPTVRFEGRRVLSGGEGVLRHRDSFKDTSKSPQAGH